MTTFLLAAGILAAAAPAPAPDLTILARQVRQEGGAWVVEYRLAHPGPAARLRAPGRFAARVEGWVSNARVPGHGVPRPSAPAIDDPEAHPGGGEVCLSATAAVLPAARGGDGPACAEHLAATLRAAPDATATLRLRLEHRHDVYGPYDPLLGGRDVTVTLGGAVLRDRLVLDRDRGGPPPGGPLPEPPVERRDPRYRVAGPDSLHLEAHVPGHHSYRYPDIPVRYGTRMRLSFWYLVAAGTDGEPRARLQQYRDTPHSWRMLDGAGAELPLRRVGRWTKVEYAFTTHAEATTLAIDFRVAGDGDIGEVWIDDARVEPAGAPPAGCGP